MRDSVLIRVDGSRQMGLGHVARMATLAEAFRRAGREVTFAVHRDSEIATRLLRATFEVASVAGAPASTGDAEETARLADLRHASIVLVDGYQFNPPYFRLLRTPTRFLCYVDDLFAPLDGCDAVLNNNIYADREHYAGPLPSTTLLGPTYALVADSFVEARRRPRAGGAEHLLVVMGGGDEGEPAQKVLAALTLPAVARSPLSVRVVVGAASGQESLERLRAMGEHCGPHEVQVVHAVTDMAERMVWADLAITAGGTTCFELSCVGVPALAIAVAENQRRVVAALEARGLMQSLGWHADVSSRRIAEHLDALRTDEAERRRMVDAQQALIDGKGADRVAAAILEARAKP